MSDQAVRAKLLAYQPKDRYEESVRRCLLRMFPKVDPQPAISDPTSGDTSEIRPSADDSLRYVAQEPMLEGVS